MRLPDLFVGVAFVVLLGAGCFRATFVRDVPAAGPMRSKPVIFFLYGLVGDRTIDVNGLCPGGSVRVIRTGMNFGQGLVAGLTLGIVTPRKIWVQCGGAAAAEAAPARGAVILPDGGGRPRSVVMRRGDGGVDIGAVTAGAEGGGRRATFAADAK
jgi:hypothetical protein